MKGAYLVLAALTCLNLTACGSLFPHRGDIVSVVDVVKRIKTDVATYNAYALLHSKDERVGKCGSAINFYIDQVTVQLATKNDDTKGGSAGLVIPIGAGTFEPGFNRSSEMINSRTVTFNLYKNDSKNSPGDFRTFLEEVPPTKESPSFEKFPITASLRELREGLLEASRTTPDGTCLALSKADDEGNTLEYAITAIDKIDASGDIKFTVISLGAKKSRERTFGNVVTVTFKAAPGEVVFK
jgi:hypothetical protein